jgi:F-type H+-transporting ATPase subunit a
MSFFPPQPVLSQALQTPSILAVSIDAQTFPGFGAWFTNSVFVAGIVLVVLLWLAKKATKKLRPVPQGAQNFFEFLIEGLYGQVENIVGPKVAPKAFPLLATIFLFVVTANWFGLLPGVGTIGFGARSGPLTLDPNDHSFMPLLRPATADLNMTLGIAVCFMIIWLVITLKEVGVIGFIKHVFAPKGGLKGMLAVMLAPIFVFVGLIELISIAFRPVSLSLRLFGNVFAGESLLHAMSALGDKWGPIGSFLASVIIPLPFYFLELLVGILQAVVFALLCAVYIQLSTTHDDDHGEEGHH